MDGVAVAILGVVVACLIFTVTFVICYDCYRDEARMMDERDRIAAMTPESV